MRKHLPYFIAGAIAVSLIAVWYLLVFNTQSGSVKKEQQRLTDLEAKAKQLQTTIDRRLELKKREPQTRAALIEFKQNIPDTPDLAEFIWANYDIARQAGIRWSALRPNLPTAPKTGGVQAAEIKMQISVDGGYFQVLDYLIRLEKLRRTVVVDTIQLTVDAETTRLTVQLGTRMFAGAAGLPWTPSDSDMALIYPQNGGATQRGQIPGPPEAGCTPPQPGFSEGQQPNNLGNCSGQMNVPRAGAPVPQAPSGPGIPASPNPSPAPGTQGGTGPTGTGPQQSGGGDTGYTQGRSGP